MLFRWLGDRMSDAELPKDWEAAARWFLGGTIVFASGFEAVVLFWEGKFLPSAGSLFVAVALMAILLKWAWLKSKMPSAASALTRAVADARLWAILLVVLAVGFRLPDPRSPLDDWIYALPLFIGLVLFFAAWKYLKTPRKTEEAVALQAGAAPKDSQSARDLLLLLDFAVYQTTADLLDSLIGAAPQRVLNEQLVLAADRYEETTKYLQQVHTKLAGSHRMSDIATQLYDGERQAELQIRLTPPDQRAAGIDPLDLRKWAIANRQCWLVHQYLIRQLAEVKETIRTQRDGLLDQYRLRSSP